mmetsp:Transcript_44162/g.103957  ORF Transcript_44162/g.103957 Transcript_44162/m.103957 type:complete len:256 (+) Transcript_44162:1117-1884(+)
MHHVEHADFDGPEGLGDDAQDGNPREVGELGERLREVDPEVLGDASRGHVPRRKPCPAVVVEAHAVEEDRPEQQRRGSFSDDGEPGAGLEAPAVKARESDAEDQQEPEEQVKRSAEDGDDGRGVRDLLGGEEALQRREHEVCREAQRRNHRPELRLGRCVGVQVHGVGEDWARGAPERHHWHAHSELRDQRNLQPDACELALAGSDRLRCYYVQPCSVGEGADGSHPEVSYRGCREGVGADMSEQRRGGGFHDCP